MEKKKYSLIHLAVSATLGLGGAVWLTVMLFKYYNVDTNALKAPSFATTAFGIYLLIGSAAAVVVGCALIKKDENVGEIKKNAYIAPAVLFALSSVLCISYFFDKNFAKASAAFITFTVLCALSALVAAIYFMMKRSGSKYADFLSLSLPLWAVFALASSYFNAEFTYASFVRAIINLSLSAIILFSLSHVRRILGRGYRTLRTVSSSVALVLGISYLLSRIIYGFASGSYMKISDMEEIAAWGMMIFIITSLVSGNAAPAPTSEPIKTSKKNDNKNPPA